MRRGYVRDTAKEIAAQLNVLVLALEGMGRQAHEARASGPSPLMHIDRRVEEAASAAGSAVSNAYRVLYDLEQYVEGLL